MGAVKVFAGFLVLLMLAGCGLSRQGRPVTAAVVVEHDMQRELHLLVLPGGEGDQGALIYAGPQWGALLEGTDAREIQRLIGVRPTYVYIVEDLQLLMRFSRMLSRLSGFDSPDIFSYGNGSPLFWNLLIGQASLLADEQVLPLLEDMYDPQQVTPRELGEHLKRLSRLKQPLAHIEAVSPDHPRELLQLQISQVHTGVQGE